jgi:arsenate reductase (thioredoxin)
LLRHHAGDAIEVRSVGSLPADQVNPAAVEAMAEVDINITAQRPEVLTTEAVEASDVVAMGCGDARPIFAGKRYLDWAREDPASRGVRPCAPSATTLSAGSAVWPPSGARPAAQRMTRTSTARSSAQSRQIRSVVNAGLDRLRARARQTRSARLSPERCR